MKRLALGILAAAFLTGFTIATVDGAPADSPPLSGIVERYDNCVVSAHANYQAISPVLDVVATIDCTLSFYTELEANGFGDFSTSRAFLTVYRSIVLGSL